MTILHIETEVLLCVPAFCGDWQDDEIIGVYQSCMAPAGCTGIDLVQLFN
eukprot:m.491982 g.491982  ORF g.491982 m.491982 type:complete len:50 (-) comp110903_c0_seq1:147-296(-)